jgi:hypothetical protein
MDDENQILPIYIQEQGAKGASISLRTGQLKMIQLNSFTWSGPRGVAGYTLKMIDYWAQTK